MKKLLSVFLVLVMVICFSVTAFAKGGFVSSPSENLAPEIIEPTDGSIVITSYADRHNLAEKQRNEMENAYTSIKNSENLTDLNSKLEDIAKSKNIDSANLSVSDLFNIGYEGNNPSGVHTLKLKSDTMNNFVALMVYVNGEWIIVDGAKIQNGNLVFTAKHFGPYAIVVNTDTSLSPQTGIDETAQSNSTNIAFYGTLMLISACGALVMWKKSRKYTA